MNPDVHSEPSKVAHDLKTPLTSIQMLLHLLHEQKVGPLNERQKMMVGQAMNDCTRLVEKIQKHLESQEDD